MPAMRHPERLSIAAGVLAPFVVCAATAPFRDSLANTNVALVLVLVIVAVAAAGSRAAGVVAAVSSAFWFDFFLTEPYQRFTVNDRTDVETTILLLAVGVGVTELAQWGRRASERAAREQSYLAGIQHVAAAVAQGSSSGDLLDEVGRQLTSTLGLRSCQFQYGVAGLGEPARLLPDGTVVHKSAVVDVDRDGLPVDRDIELLAESGGLLQGRFLMTAGADARPSQAQRLVAVTLAAQVGSAIRGG